MKIVIMRHGKPDLDLEEIKFQKIPAVNLAKIVGEYEKADLDQWDLPLDDSVIVATACAASICSDLPRAVSSVNVLGLDKINEIDPIFREAGLPYLKWKRPKLTFFSWAVIFRLAWLCGFSRNGESIRNAKSRAKLGAKTLEDLAREKATVLHVGHGVMNRLLVKELVSRSWKIQRSTGEKYWSYTVLEYRL